MKKLELHQSREEIFESVALSTAYRTVRRAEGRKDPEGVMSAADRCLAAAFFDEAVGNLLTLLRPLMTAVENTDSDLRVSFKVSDDWPQVQKEAATLHLREYLRCALLGQWLETVGSADNAQFGAAALAHLSDLGASLYDRQPPVRPN